MLQSQAITTKQHTTLKRFCMQPHNTVICPASSQSQNWSTYDNPSMTQPVPAILNLLCFTPVMLQKTLHTLQLWCRMHLTFGRAHLQHRPGMEHANLSHSLHCSLTSMPFLCQAHAVLPTAPSISPQFSADPTSCRQTSAPKLLH